MLIAFLFLVLILLIVFTIEPINFKKSYSQITKKYLMQKTSGNFRHLGERVFHNF